MTVNPPENNTAAAIPQEKVDINLSQVQVDTNLSQQEKTEDGKQEDPNWRAFREARKKDRADKEAAERRAAEKEAEAAALKAAMEAAFARGSAPINQGYQNDYQQEESEDDRIEKRVNAVLAQREAAAERERQEREQQEYPNRLNASYPDFNAVISSENLDYLEFHYPEVARPLKRLNDSYEKWEDVYKAVKKFVPNNTTAKRESARADANFNKPKSMSSASMTQPGESMSASRLTEEKRAANWARMQAMLKSVG